MSYAYSTPTAAGGASPVTIACSKESGSIFPIGSTTVTCTATDARLRTDACSFTVTIVAPPRIQLTRFVAFGDSITLGEDGRVSLVASSLPQHLRPFFVFPDPQTYPGALADKLKARYTAQIQSLSVVNAGKRGEYASDSGTLIRFNNVIGGNVEAVLLMEGTNDINALQPALIPAAIAGLRSMIQSARVRGVRVYLATIPPEVAGLEKANAPSAIAPYNVLVRGLAGSENVPLVDVESGFGAAYQQYIGYDGLHPNEAGYAKIADLFLERLQATLEVTTPSTTTSAGRPPGFPYSPIRRRR